LKNNRQSTKKTEEKTIERKENPGFFWGFSIKEQVNESKEANDFWKTL